MENAEIAKVFEEIARMLALDDANAFRVRSYQNAARTIRSHPRRMQDLVEAGEDLSKLPSIGAKTANKIRELVSTGSAQRLEELKQAFPDELTDLMHVPGLGPRKVMKLHEALGVTDLDSLEDACREHLVRDVQGMGEKTESAIIDGIAMLRKTKGRFSLQAAERVVESIGRHLGRCPDVAQWEVAGSFRRHKETVGDLDILIRADSRSRATDQILAHEAVSRVLRRGRERVSVRLEGGMQVDFRFFENGAFGSALLYFTGSKAHNIRLRRLAQDRRWKLSEYGLFSGDRLLAGTSEEAVYNRLRLGWIPPELREDRGEIDAARDGRLPRLLELDDVRGDLQCHTTASDGRNTIREMAEAARRLGHRYLAVTDHSKRVTMARGLDDDGARRHAEAIREVDASLDEFWLMAGIEVDVLKDGSLDLQPKTLEGLDWVLASIHYDLRMSRDRMTNRLLAAINSGLVHAIAHPLGRVIGRREPIDFDADAVFEACAQQGVLLEVNAAPHRLDLPDHLCQRAKEAGVRFSLGTDAHRTDELDQMRYGVYVARRGWLQAVDVVNTKSTRALRRLLART